MKYYVVALLSVFLTFLGCSREKVVDEHVNSTHITDTVNNEPWVLGCENSTNTIEIISCSYRSYEISDSILTTLHNELIIDLQRDAEGMKGMIEGPNDSTYIKYYETTVKTIEEYKKSMDLFYEYRDRMINVMTLQYNEGMMVCYYENSFGTQINEKQIEILRLLKGE